MHWYMESIDEIQSFVDNYVTCDKFLLFVNLCKS
jgi:hypothetical protein